MSVFNGSVHKISLLIFYVRLTKKIKGGTL